MNRQAILLVTMLTAWTVVPCAALADAQSDLAAGREALKAGDLDKALPLLKSAAQNLPQSVEAQAALGQVQLRLGDLDEALKAYQAVAKLSPDHAEAKRIVEALTGRQQTFAQKLAYARALMDMQSYTEAAKLLHTLATGPAEDAQRLQARLALAECRLWANQAHTAGTSALEVIKSADAAAAAQARAIIALAQAGQALRSDKDTAALQLAEDMLKQLGRVAAPWDARAELARLCVQLIQDPTKAAEVSAKLTGPVGSVPDSPFERDLVRSLHARLSKAVHLRIRQGDLTGAMAVAWPMVSDQAVPAAEVVLKPVAVKGGWLAGSDRQSMRLASAGLLRAVGEAEVQTRSYKAGGLGLWLAAQAMLAEKPTDNTRATLVSLISQLNILSRPVPGRQKGAPISVADEMQYQLIMALAGRLEDSGSRSGLVTHISALLNRYAAWDELEAGLARFVKIDPAPAADAPKAIGPPLKVELVGGFAAWPVGVGRQHLLGELMGRYSQLGEKAFRKAAATLDPAANSTLNRFDQVAVLLYAEMHAAPIIPSGKKVLPFTVLPRYEGAEKWEVAEAGLRLMWSKRPPEQWRWGLAHFYIRHARAEEDKLLNLRKRLPDKLNPLIVQALGELKKTVPISAGWDRRRQLTSAASSLVAYYEGLERPDLAREVIDTFVGPRADDEFADWGLWARANLLHQEAGRAVGRLAPQFDGGKNLPLNPLHAAELKLLDELVSKFPKSDYVAPAVGLVIEVSRIYQNYKAFAPATAVVTDFLKAHPKTSKAERLEYELALISMHKAQVAFAKREDKDTPPAKLSDEYAAAIDALAGFLKAHPRGDYAGSAASELFRIARTYGQADAWPIARDVLKRFAAAVPEFTSPPMLRFYEAATYLGELDREHGLALLTLPTPPAPPAPATGPRGGGVSVAEFASDELAKRLDVTDYTGGTFDRPVYSVAAPEPDARTTPDGVALPSPVLPPGASGRPSNAGEGRDVGHGYAGLAPQPAPAEDNALAMIRRSEQLRIGQIAMLQDRQVRGQQQGKGQQDQAVVLPSGPVLSEAEMKRQDTAADAAYKILIDLIAKAPADRHNLPGRARAEVMWLIGFFEGQKRPDRAIAMIEQYLKDRPTDPDRIDLAFRVIRDQIEFAAQVAPTDRIDQDWVDQRHARFEKARQQIAAFVAAHADRKERVYQARELAVASYQREAGLAGQVSAVRAGGLLARSGQELLAISRDLPDHAVVQKIPGRLRQISSQLEGLQQFEQAIDILSRIPIRFPSDAQAVAAVLRIAELYADRLNSPLRAVEAYQEYLSLAGDRQDIRTRVFDIGRTLAAKERFLEALHVFGVFVDSFPTDPRAPQALQEIGKTHQANEAWKEAMAAYERILAEYPNVGITPGVHVAIAECHIHLSEWKAARRSYEEYLRKYPPPRGKAAQAQQASYHQLARQRIDILKNLDRYQMLLADRQVQRNKDDAQFQIGRIVLEQLGYRLKAVSEFRKVIADYPRSDLADDAQLEIGKALLALGRQKDARTELLKVPAKYPMSPLADNALYLVGSSYEQQGTRLASVSAKEVRAELLLGGQKAAYAQFQEQEYANKILVAKRRQELRQAGKLEDLSNNDAYFAARYNGMNTGNLLGNVRQFEQQAETESALQVANRQDRINEAYRKAVNVYGRVAKDYPLGDTTGESLKRLARIYEIELKDRDAAMKVYQRIVQLFPGTPVAESAALKVAKFHEQTGKFDLAVKAYRDFIRTYPASGQVPDAQYSLAEALEQLGRWVEAMDAYETFRQKFSTHAKAPAAHERIQWIKAYRK